MSADAPSGAPARASMGTPRQILVAMLPLVCALQALWLPVMQLGDAAPLHWPALPGLLPYAAAAVPAALLALWTLRRPAGVALFVGLAALACVAPLALLARQDPAAPPTWDAGFWLYVVALALLAVATLRRTAALDLAGPLGAQATAILFGAWTLVFWQLATQAFDVPKVLMPAPSQIWTALVASWDTLAVDFVQTVLHAVLIGYGVGCGAGFAVGVLIDRSPFLQRGLLPLSALASTVPLVGIAPIFVMWFGFDWASKAAVVALMTFFPMLVNTLAGLQSAGHMERDLMRSYGAGYWRTLATLRIPVALPFVFNALKVNSTLAMIGAIVAEFFGSPISGLGFRISTEAARLNMPVVWAAILVAAVSGSILFALLAWAERRLTFWHPSLRRQ